MLEEEPSGSQQIWILSYSAILTNCTEIHLPPGDILICAGDLALFGNSLTNRQLARIARNVAASAQAGGLGQP